MDLFELVARLTLDKSGYEDGINEAEKEGKGLGDKLKGAFGTVAKAGGLVTGAAGAAGAAIYGLSTKSAATADHIDKMSQRLGLSRQAYQEFDFIASQSGSSVDNLRAGMKTLTNQMGKAQKGTKDSAKLFQRLGISITDSNGEMKDQETMLWETIDALQGVENQTERATLAQQLFGKSGAELMPLINGARGSLKEMRDQAHDLGLVLDDDVIDAGVHLTDTIDQVKRSFDSIMTKVGAQVMPLVQKALDLVIQNMPLIQSIVSKAFSVLGGFVSGFVDGVNKYLMPTFKSLMRFVKNVFAGNWERAWLNIKHAFTRLWRGIGTFFTDVFTSAKDAITKIDWADVGSKIWTFIKDGLGSIVEFFTNLYTDATEAINSVDWAAVGETIWNGIKGAFNAVKNFFVTLFTGAKDGTENDIDWAGLGSAILGFIVSAFTAIRTVFSSLFGLAKKAILEDIDWAQVGSDVWNWIVAKFLAIGGWFQQRFEEVKKWILSIDWAGVGKSIWDWLVAKFLSIAGWFEKRFNEVKDWITKIDWAKVGADIWNWIVEKFLSAGSWFQKRFENAVDEIEKIDWAAVGKTIWDGIVSLVKDFAGTLKAWATTAWYRVKNINWLEVGQKLWDGITGLISTLATELWDIFTNAVNELLKFTRWGELGQALFNGIKSKAAEIRQWLSDLWHNITHPGANWTEAERESQKQSLVAEARKNEYFKKAYDMARMFTSPTVLATPRGNLTFGDGVGGEIVLSDSKLRDIAGGREVAMAIGMLTDSVDDLSASLTEKMVIALQQMGFNIDGREFARLVRSVGTN